VPPCIWAILSGLEKKRFFSVSCWKRSAVSGQLSADSAGTGSEG